MSFEVLDKLDVHPRSLCSSYPRPSHFSPTCHNRCACLHEDVLVPGSKGFVFALLPLRL